MKAVTFREVLKHAVRNADHAVGVTTRFYEVSKTVGTWSACETLIAEAEAAFRDAGGKKLPQVWKNAKSIIKAGYAVQVVTKTADGADYVTNAVVVSETFNGLKDLIKADKAAKERAAMNAAADKLADTAPSADSSATDAMVDEVLHQFTAALKADLQLLAAFRENYADIMEALESYARQKQVAILEGSAEVVSITAAAVTH